MLYLALKSMKDLRSSTVVDGLTPDTNTLLFGGTKCKAGTSVDNSVDVDERLVALVVEEATAANVGGVT